jgi:hypothetical protein
MRSFYADGAPPMLRVGAAVQALEAVALCVVAVAQVVETASGHSYEVSNGVALAVTEFITVALVAAIAIGIARVRPWSRTPAILTQLSCGLLAIILLQANRAAWGLPTLILAIAGLAALFSPASLKALSRRLFNPSRRCRAVFIHPGAVAPCLSLQALSRR